MSGWIRVRIESMCDSSASGSPSTIRLTESASLSSSDVGADGCSLCDGAGIADGGVTGVRDIVSARTAGGATAGAAAPTTVAASLALAELDAESRDIVTAFGREARTSATTATVMRHAAAIAHGKARRRATDSSTRGGAEGFTLGVLDAASTGCDTTTVVAGAGAG
jgi:hypothetical protein